MSRPTKVSKISIPARVSRTKNAVVTSVYKKRTLRICTYNVNYGCCYDLKSQGTAQAEECTSALLDCKADVCCLVETTPSWNKFLRSHKKISRKYPYQLYQNTDHWFAGGQHILSKYPFEQLNWEDAPSGWFPGLILHVAPCKQTFNQSIYLLSVHLRPPLSPTSSMPGGLSPWAYFEGKRDHVTDLQHWIEVMETSIRKKESQLHKDRDSEESEDSSEIKSSVNKMIFVLGDFNEGEGSGAYDWLLNDKKFGEARKLYDDDKHTWEWPVLSGWYTLKAKFDHLFYSIPSHIHCTNALVHQKGCSDHFPVVAEFKQLISTKN
eukprot:TRINITY_DN4620_c0_g1_i1.p1 TRINITY_DN4620_c0_g1~~TRINITY_DN4620_c0_g1_i1.p1  ORF type:complete len:322 (-),score=36.26 TRINITY_DN4620_c0_g1_i1:770-1735(-)